MAKGKGRVYDKEDERPVTEADLKKREETPETPAELLERIPTMSDEEGQALDEKRGLTDDSSHEEPPVQHESQVGKGYTPAGQNKKGGRFSRRQKIIGGGLAAALAAAVIGLFAFFLPMLRLESYLANINQRVFGFANNAVSQRVEHLFERYMILRVIHLERCGNRVTGDCRADYTNMGLAGSMFNAWRDAKIEQRLIDEYDLKFESHKNPSSKYGIDRLTIRSGKTGRVITLTEGEINEGRFTGGRREFGREINQFLKKETKWHQVMQRRSVRKYMARKHGVTFWCFLACKTRDRVELKTADAKTRFKYRFTERVVFPMSPKLGLIMQCILSGGADGVCSTEELRNRGVDRSAISDKDSDKIVADIKNNPDARLGTVLVQRLLEKIMNQTAARTTLSAIPVAGQVYLGLVIIDTLDQADRFIDKNGLSRLAADLNSRQYVEYYMLMRSTNDEMKAGALSADEVGAVMSDFNGAEQSKLYQAHYSPKKTTASLFSTKAEAQEKDPYRCANGQPIAEGELVCPEKKVARDFKIEKIRDNAYLDGLLDKLNVYRCAARLPGGICIGPQPVVHEALGLIDKIASTVLGPAIGLALDGLKHTPGMGSIVSFVESKTEQMLAVFFKKFFPLPVQLDSPGREKYDALEAGGEVAASEFGKGGYTEDGQAYGLGGRLLSPQEQAAIWQNYASQQDYEYKNSSLWAKFSRLEHQNSIASKFIAAMPTSISQLMNKLGSMLTSPFASLSLSPSANAAPDMSVSPFGIPRFGYPAGDPAFSRDPAELTEEYCQNAKTVWQNSKTEDTLTGIEQYSTTNPCLLEQVALEAAASAFTGDDSLNDGIANGGGAQPSPSPGSGNAAELAQQILNNPNITYPLDSVSPNGSTRGVLQAVAKGETAPVTCRDGSAGGTTSASLNPNILQFVLELGQQTKVGVNALTDKCHSTGSNHYKGLAVDFECKGVAFDIGKADPIAATYKGGRNSETCAANSHWHYDFLVRP